MTQALEKFERFANAFSKLGNVMDKIPRLVEMGGVALFAGRASERLGGDFATGAVAGATMDGLAHSNLSHNQIGGVGLTAYFAALGIINLLPDSLFVDRDDENCETVLETIGIQECGRRGGVVDSVTGELIIHNPFFSEAEVVCAFKICTDPEENLDFRPAGASRPRTPPSTPITPPVLPSTGPCPPNFARRGAGGRCVRVRPDPIQPPPFGGGGGLPIERAID